MRSYPHGARRLPDDLGNSGRIQAGHHAKHDDLSLIGRQRGDRRHHSSRGELLERNLGSVWRHRTSAVSLAEPLEQRPAARREATQVDGPVPGDREQPGPEGSLVAAESGQAGYDLQPGIARDVIGGIGSGHLQVPQQ